MIKENKETILQLGVKMRISCLQPDLFPVHEAMLETICLCSHILSHNYSIQLFISLVLRTLNHPPWVSAVMGVDCTWKSNN